eukprot:gene64890-88764_t
MSSNSSAGDGRKIDRISCHVRGTLRFNNQTSNVRITDLSKNGLGLQLRDWIAAGPGSKVTIQAGEFGTMQGIVRWYRAGSMGVMIDQTSNTTAQIEAYLKNFHQHAKRRV